MDGPLALVGLMGSGKTSVGAALARRLGWPHVDLDAELERVYGQTVARQFEKHGEAVFRRREAVLLKAWMRRRCVLSTGGGVVLDPASRALLAAGTTVYLQASPAVLAGRLKGRQARARPLLRGAEPKRVLARLHRQRGPLYRKVAALTVRASLGDAQAVAARILERFKLPC